MDILGTDYDVITLDFETYYGKGCSLSLQKLNTMSYINHPDFSIHGCGIKVNDAPTEYVEPDGLEDRLRELFEDNDRPTALVCHNTYFDGMVLHLVYDLHPDLYLDTMGMSRGMFPNRKHGLKDLAERLWPNDPRMRKGEELEKFYGVTTLELLADAKKRRAMRTYCIQDVDLTYAAFMRMVPYYPDDELELIHLTLQMDCEPILHLDTERVARARAGWIKERDALIKASGFAESTLSSDKKFLELLQRKGVTIKYKPKPKGEEGEVIPALGKADLGFQQMKAAHPELAPLFAGRIAAKSTGQITRAARFIETAGICGGQMPCPLIYYSAHTGRYGGGEKLNLQNLQRGSELRKSLIAPAGSLVYVADSSNIEARMLAWIADQDDLLAVFRSGGDVYSHFASKLYGFEVNKTDHPHERFVGKVCVLGLGYGMGWRKFQESMAAGMLGGDPVLLTEQEARSIVNLYRTANFKIVAFWEQAQQAIVDMFLGNERSWGPLSIAKDMLILPNGMTLQYPGLRPMDELGNDFEYWNGKFWTKIYGGKLTENIIQALARIVLFEQMLDVNRNVLVPIGGRVALNVHDEIIGVGPSGGARRVHVADPEAKGDKDRWEDDTFAQELFAKIVAKMTTPRRWCPDLPLEAEGGYAPEYSK